MRVLRSDEHVAGNGEILKTLAAALLRVAVIGLWTFGACWGWLLVFYWALQLLLYCQLRYRWDSLSQWTPLWATTSLVFGGMFLVGAVMLLLAVAGRLPGTSRPCS